MNLRNRVVLFCFALFATTEGWAQTITLSPTCGKPGDAVCITGAGWAEPSPVCRYTYKFDGNTVAADQPDGLFGPPNRKFIVPKVADGNHTVRVELRLNFPDSLLQAKDTPFKVVSTAPNPWTPLPTAGTSVNLTFNPANVCDVSPCTSIVFIQVKEPVGVKADGSTRALTHTEQGFPNAAKLDADLIGGRSVDYIVGENDPYYNGDDSADGGAKGVQGPSPSSATMSDHPKRSDSAYPADISAIRLNFEVAAFCRAGEDKGKYFGRLLWSWQRAKGAATVNGVTSGISADRNQPSAGFISAVTKWNTGHAFTSKFPTPTTITCF